MTAEPSPVTISDDAKQLLRERMAASGTANPIALLTMTGMEPAKPAADNDDVDWTIQRRDLWTLVVVDGASRSDGGAKAVVVDGLRFASDYFPIRFDISATKGRFRVAAAA